MPGSGLAAGAQADPICPLCQKLAEGAVNGQGAPDLSEVVQSSKKQLELSEDELKEIRRAQFKRTSDEIGWGQREKKELERFGVAQHGKRGVLNINEVTGKPEKMGPVY